MCLWQHRIKTRNSVNGFMIMYHCLDQYFLIRRDSKTVSSTYLSTLFCSHGLKILQYSKYFSIIVNKSLLSTNVCTIKIVI